MTTRLCITLLPVYVLNKGGDTLMEWTDRGASQNQVNNQPTHAANQVPGVASNRGAKNKNGGKDSMSVAKIALLFSITLLVVAVIALVAVASPTTHNQNKFIDDTKMQAVFLNGGQVYFGNIRDLNSKYLRINNIYYLRVNQQVQPNSTTASANDISLVKLGCELHGPQDEMYINTDQVVFWENLKTDGQVAKAVAQYVKANPDGQKCDTTSATSNSSTTPSTTTPSTNSTTTNTTKKQ